MSPAQALIAAMLTPALLILAAGSLIAAALVRLGRVVDRVRALGALAASAPVSLDELANHERRAKLALAAITCYFIAVALFVAAGLAIALDRLAGDALTWLPVGLTLAGMVLIVAGVAAMALESRSSSALIVADIATIRRRITQA